MKQKKGKIVEILLSAAILCAGLPQSAQAASFVDVPKGAWYQSSVNELVDLGVISGTSATEFSPNGTVTRSQFATMLARAALTKDELRQYDFKSDFKDVPKSHWATRYINWAYEAGVVNGCGNNTFAPEKPVTREEMAAMIANFSRAMGREMTAVNAAVSFTDSGSISKFAVASVQKCQRAGVISGYQDGSFRPKGIATRAEAAAMCCGLLRKCPAGDCKIIRKRINSIPVRAVEFDPSLFSADLIMGRDVSDGGESPDSLVKRSGAVVAANAAFFDMSSYQALGTLIRHGRVVTVFDRYAPAKSAFAMDSSNRFSIENFTTSHTVTLHKEDGTDSVLKGVTVNRWPSSDKDSARILFTRDWGHELCFAARDAVTIAEDGTVLAVAQNADVPIPETGYVLAQRSRRQYEGDFFDACKVGDVLDIQRVYEGASTQELVLSIGAGPRIVKDGAACGSTAAYREEGFTDPNVVSYDASRICIGIKADGRLVILSSYGALEEMAAVMVKLGCVDALNFDGGGSANLYVNGQWLKGPQDRKLNNMLIFK